MLRLDSNCQLCPLETLIENKKKAIVGLEEHSRTNLASFFEKGKGTGRFRFKFSLPKCVWVLLHVVYRYMYLMGKKSQTKSQI